MIEGYVAESLGIGVDAAGFIILMAEAGSAIFAIGYGLKKLLDRNRDNKDEIKSLINEKYEQNKEAINHLQGCADNINMKCDSLKEDVQEAKHDIKDIRSRTQINSEKIVEIGTELRTHLKSKS